MTSLHTRPGVLYEEVVEVSERLVLDPAGEVIGVTGEKLTVEKPIYESKLRTQAPPFPVPASPAHLI